MPDVRSLLARAHASSRRALMVAALAGASAAAATPSASAEEARPVPRSPFVCGQAWFARTYAGHPSFAIDWNLPGAGEADFGQPVLAGGAGIATAEIHSGYGNMVTVDHGGGWKTLYAHLSTIEVATGQPVSETTIVGRVGNTGRSDGSHLHHEQLLNGVRQPLQVDGVRIVPSFSSRAALYQSGNCPLPEPERPRSVSTAWAQRRVWRAS